MPQAVPPAVPPITNNRLSDEQQLVIIHVTNELTLLQGVPWADISKAGALRPYVERTLFGGSIECLGTFTANPLADCIQESFYRFRDAYSQFLRDMGRVRRNDEIPSRATLWKFLHEDIKALYIRTVTPERSTIRRPFNAPQLTPVFLNEHITQVVCHLRSPPVPSSRTNAAATHGNLTTVPSFTRSSDDGYTTEAQWSDFLRSIVEEHIQKWASDRNHTL